MICGHDGTATNKFSIIGEKMTPETLASDSKELMDEIVDYEDAGDGINFHLAALHTEAWLRMIGEDNLVQVIHTLVRCTSKRCKKSKEWSNIVAFEGEAPDEESIPLLCVYTGDKTTLLYQTLYREVKIADVIQFYSDPSNEGKLDSITCPYH